jgi:hypothetical protein
MERYETYLAFAQNSGRRGVQTQAGLKEMATILGEEGWRICGVWPSMQGGNSGFGMLCQRPIEPSVERIVDIPAALIEDSVNQFAGTRTIETVTVTDAMIEEGFKCPVCGMVSHNPNDIVEQYCGNCHDWTGGKSGN